MSTLQSSDEGVVLESSAAPHLLGPSTSTRRMMADVLIGLIPVVLASIWFFGLDAIRVASISIAVAVATEVVVCRIRHRPVSIGDGSVLITSVILALTLPPTLPWYAICLGSFVAVTLGKHVFGGLGQNLFNPAMVGRAFLMACFPAAMTTWIAPSSYSAGVDLVDGWSGATPLSAAKFSESYVELSGLLTGNVSGSLGETSALMIMAGGLWILVRGAGDWRLTAGTLASVSVIGMTHQLIRGSDATFGWMHHLAAGGIMLAAFFIVTDPVTSPLSKSGRWCFGLFVGSMTMVIRLFAGYPEGVMFSVLLANAISPLINQWTRPRPVGFRERPHD